MMKKHYLLGLALVSVFSVNAQNTVDFESTALAADTFNNGSDLSGGFTYFDAHFSNFYDTTFAYNTGFSISNKTDVSTPGYTNQYSAITGSGYNSSNYAIFYPFGQITLGSSIAKMPMNAKITNTTYAVLSMMNGDGVGKKFGDTLNANGVNDGTNGEDFFLLNIYGHTLIGDTTGQVQVVLADYRFSDNSQDFIVQDWIDVDLWPLNSAVGVMEYISFSFESSDVGTFGVNTPTYFALDDITFGSGTFGLDELTDQVQVYPNPVSNVMNINKANGELKISDAFGKTVFEMHLNGNSSIDFSEFTSGVYWLSIENEDGIFTKKIIK